MAPDGLPVETIEAKVPNSSTAAWATILAAQYWRAFLGRHPVMEVTDGSVVPDRSSA